MSPTASPSFSAAFEWVRRHVDAGRLPGAVLGIANSYGVLALDAFGGAAGHPVRVGDRYPLFSVTKPLVGITAARAIERGMLTSNTPLSAAIPEFGHNRDDIVRLWHLASHTSGITEPPLDTSVRLRTELVTRGRDFAAGTASRYSTLAYEGMAALIEHATGATWHTAISEWAATVGATGLSCDLADAHEIPDAAEAGVDMERLARLRSPGAGLAGTTEDLLAVGSDLLRIGQGAGDGILKPPTLRMMLRPLTGDIPRLEPYPASRGQDWGFSWNLPRRAPGLIDRDLFGHSGWAGTEFWVHPGAGICWVLLTNKALRPDIDTDELDNAIIGAL